MPRREQPVARLCWTLDGVTELELPGPNRLAADGVLAAAGAVLGDVDQALATSFVMLAAAVDADPTNASLWGQYRAAEASIRGVLTGGDDEFSAVIAAMSADLRDAEVAES